MDLRPMRDGTFPSASANNVVTGGCCNKRLQRDGRAPSVRAQKIGLYRRSKIAGAANRSVLAYGRTL